MNRRSAKHTIAYLVGGMRISVKDSSLTPGPRTHILSMINAWENLGMSVSLTMSSDFPLMGRFTRVKLSDVSAASRAKVLIADIIRLGASLWCGLNVFVRALGRPRPDVIYERSAVFQNLTAFHPAKRRAVRVVEANGVLSREAARDRKGVVLESVAASMERRVLRRADVVVAISEALKSELVEFANLDPTKVHVVPNAVERTATEIPRRDGDTLVIGFLGSFARWHHLPDVVKDVGENWERLEKAAQGRRVEFHLIGDGPDREQVERAAQLSGHAENIRAMGSMPREAAFDECRGWSVGIAPHRRSSSKQMYHSPIKLYEYAALGMVLVCTPSRDAQSLADSGVPTVDYDGDDAAGLVNALERAVSLAAERTPAQIAAARADVTREHTWESRANQILEQVEQIQEGRQ